jgi:hypothetical protein
MLSALQLDGLDVGVELGLSDLVTGPPQMP